LLGCLTLAANLPGRAVVAGVAVLVAAMLARQLSGQRSSTSAT
jgi:hypothetical protein